MTSTRTGRGAGVGFGRRATGFRSRLLATTLLVSPAAALPGTAAHAQSPPEAGQPSNADLMRLINGLQADVQALRTENHDLKAEVEHLQADTVATQVVAQAATAAVAPPPKPVYGGMPVEGLPAVSALNFKVDLAGGELQSAGALAGEASVAVPISHSYGVQLDARGSFTAAGTVYAGGAGRWFWRDPSKGLIGFYGSYSTAPGTG